MELNENKMRATLLIGLVVLAVAGQASATLEATRVICRVLDSIFFVLYVIAGGVGAVVIVLQGVKWTASDADPGARKQAKEGIIHAIIGLIIVLVAIALVELVMGPAIGCPIGP